MAQDQRLELRWATPDHGTLPIGEALEMSEATGLSEIDIAEISERFPADAILTAEVSSQGRGASGPAIAVVVQLERIGTDAASLIAIGGALRELVRRVRRKFGRDPTIEDPMSLGALAASGCDSELTGMRYISTVPITAYPGVGTNWNDVWAACFKEPEEAGAATVIFISPSGTCLGVVRVPIEVYRGKDGPTRRSPEEIQGWWTEG